MTKEELRQYRYLAKEIELMQKEIDRLRTSLLAAPQIDGMPKSNYVADRTAATVAKIVDIQEILNQKLRQYITLRGEIENCISALPSELRILMRLRYIEGLRWEAIAVQLNYGWRQVHRKHARALRMI